MILKTFARFSALSVAVGLAAVVLAAQAPTAVLTIHADQPVSKVSPTLYGLMTEEINHSYDGGLYAEMVQNRTFRSSLVEALTTGFWSRTAMPRQASAPMSRPAPARRCRTASARCEAGRPAEPGRRVERWLLGHGAAAEHDLQGIVLRQGRLRRTSAR